MIEEMNSVVLATELPASGLQSGDIGTVLHVNPDGQTYEVMFVTLEGKTVGVMTLNASQIRPIAPQEIAHARRLDGSAG